MRYYLIPFKMAIIKKPKNNKCWRGYGRKQSPPTLLGRL